MMLLEANTLGVIGALGIVAIASGITWLVFAIFHRETGREP